MFIINLSPLINNLQEFDPFYVIVCTCSHSKKCKQKCEYSHYLFALVPEVRTIVCTPILSANGNPTGNIACAGLNVFNVC